MESLSFWSSQTTGPSNTAIPHYTRPYWAAELMAARLAFAYGKSSNNLLSYDKDNAFSRNLQEVRLIRSNIMKICVAPKLLIC